MLLRTAICAITSLLILAINAQRVSATPVTWIFTETSCTSEDGGCFGTDYGGSLPLVVAMLELPDLDTSGFFSITDAPVGCVINGFSPPECVTTKANSDNFTFLWIDTGGLDLPRGAVDGIDFSFDSSAAGLTFSLSDYPDFLDTQADIGGTNLDTSGLIGSDGTMFGCGFDNACEITGTWQVPEPSSASVMAGGLLILSFFQIVLWLLRRERFS